MEPSYFVHPSAIIDLPCEIGSGTRIWHFSHISAGCEIGENCNLGQNVYVAPQVKLGRNVKVQNNVSLYEGVICEEDVFLGPSCVFTNILIPRSAVVRKGQYIETLLKKGVSIGANATIVCGITLSPFVMVGAGAVVTKSFPAYALVVGNPAKQIGWVSEFGHRLDFTNNAVTSCPESGQEYRLVAGEVIQLPS